MRHGIVVPASKTGAIPARVVNVRSRRSQANNSRLRLDKLLRSTKPVICIKRRLGGIGDVLMTTPLLKAIKQLIPHCHLIYATDLQYSEGALGDIIRHNPYVDEVIPNTEIRESSYDYSVDVTTTGLDRERAGKVPPNRIDMFGEEAGIDISNDPLPVYIVKEEERIRAQEELKQITSGDKNIQVIAIQVRSNDARRTWPLERMAELAHSLAEESNIKVLLFDWGCSVPQWTRTHENMWLMMDRSFIDTAALIEQSDVIICPDSSMLHIAGALNKKIVAIFGPIPPESRINYYTNAVPVTNPLLCSNCVVGDSYILTNRGYKEIQDIAVNDYVYTIDGKFEKVTEVHINNRANRDLLEINVFGSNEPITTTEDHEILISQRTYSWKSKDWKPTGARRKIPKFSKPAWVQAKDIQVGYYCCIPRPITNNISTHSLLKNENLAWLVGLFIAEGWTYSPSKLYRTYLSIGATEKNFIKRIRNIINCYPDIFHSKKQNKGFVAVRPNSRGNSIVVTINNKAFMAALHDLFNVPEGQTINNASKKHIPYSLLHANENIIKSFLIGLQEGDGYNSKTDIVYSTSSRELAYGIQLLCSKLGKFSKIYKRTRNTNFKKNAVIYRIHESKQKYWKRWYEDDIYIYIPVKMKQKSNRIDQKVYDITVENNPTFTIQNIGIRDCWYNPVCIRDEGHKLECLTGISVKQVKAAVIEKLKAPLMPQKNIMYGQNITLKGQDPIILIRRATNGIGDILTTTPGIDALKAKFPDKEIHVACPADVMPALENNPSIDKLIDCNEGLNYKRYYMMIDISTPCATYEATRITSNRPVQKSRVEIFAEAMGIRQTITSLKPRYYVTEEEKVWAKDFLSKTLTSPKPKVAVGLRSAELYRNWPEKYYSALFDLLNPHIEVIILDHSREQIYNDVVDACGFPLRKAIAILSECDGLITVDTSLLHFGAALNLPTVALFGPIDYKSRCKGYDNVTVITANLPCSPCWRNARMPCKQTGFIKAYSKCLDVIQPQRIADIILKKFKGDK